MDQSEDTSIQTKKYSVPKVPIKTYKWEDVRRARKKGGYPWTYLYKQDLAEEIMDTCLRKTKASSPSDSLDIKEITEDDVKGLENIDSSYVVIEGPILVDELKEETNMLESAACSSDNISQYLEKEELPSPVKPEERAKSEEPRKRKLSIESNYSLSKQRFMKRLKDAKEKLTSVVGRTSSKREKVKSIEKVHIPMVTNPVHPEHPVYIHIPLKPPEGKTDEFSYLEFEDKRPPLPEVQIEVVEDNVEVPETGPKTVDELGLSVPLNDDQEDDVSAVIFLDGDNTGGNEEYDIMVVDIDEKGQEMTMSQVTSTEVRRQFLESLKKVESQADLNENVKQNSTSNLSRSSSRGSERKHQRRAKSAEPEKKRKTSIESSHSTRSTNILKKIKGFQELLPFKKKSKPIEKKEEIKVPSTTSPSPKPSSNDDPVYIHIPLKPPPGETDEFSHLELGNASNETLKNENDPIPIAQVVLLTPPVIAPPTEFPSDETDKKGNEETMTIDEEDGLKSTQDNKKSNIKNEVSPSLKKKVSFKRRKSAENNKNDSYENIGGEEVPSASGKWSTSSDHEYEPVNPPSSVLPETITVETVVQEEDKMTPVTPTNEKNPPKKFQTAKIKENATKFKNKLQKINISLPPRPKFPDMPKINFRRCQRRSSDVEKKETTSLNGKSDRSNFFSNFSTYPRRLMKKRQYKLEQHDNPPGVSYKTTTEITSNVNQETNNNNSGSIRIPLHGDQEIFDKEQTPDEPKNVEQETEWVESEIVTDLDQPDPPSAPIRQKAKFQQNDSIDSRKVGSSNSSLGVHRRGVLEEIDSDQFFLREKGISQDNIDMGRYLSTEIREAFRTPQSNALSDMYDGFRTSNQSLPETREQIKKPRRKKALERHSHEKFRYESEEDIDYNYMPPIPPKRRSKKRERNNFHEQVEEDTMHLQTEMMIRRASEPVATPPPRPHRSLKSLNASESIIFDEPPKPPSRSRSKTRSMSRADSSMFEDKVPVVEEPCVKDLRDAMGYAIVDKSQIGNWEHKFCTVPVRKRNEKPPERPQRNYSTLVPSRPPRKKNMTDEEKENIDITRYIEIDEKDVEKIQKRPLPPPPRPPRSKTPTAVNENEVSTQTEPLPSDFVCEQVVQEETDKIMTPTVLRRPTHYTYEEETITHGQLLVEPLNGAQILPENEMTQERIIPVTTTNENAKIAMNKLQVTDLDVERLTVNELVASKIIVTEIDSGSLASNEIKSKSASLKLGDIELEPNVVKKLLEKIQQHESQDEDAGQKKKLR